MKIFARPLYKDERDSQNFFKDKASSRQPLAGVHTMGGHVLLPLSRLHSSFMATASVKTGGSKVLIRHCTTSPDGAFHWVDKALFKECYDGKYVKPSSVGQINLFPQGTLPYSSDPYVMLPSPGKFTGYILCVNDIMINPASWNILCRCSYDKNTK